MPLPWLIGAAVVGGVAYAKHQSEKKRARHRALRAAERDYPSYSMEADDDLDAVFVYSYDGSIIQTYDYDDYWPKD